MRILGQYPKSYNKPIRVDYFGFKIRDRVVIGVDSYFIIETDDLTILLDRPLKRATKWNESIHIDGSIDLNDLGFIGLPDDK